MRISKHTHGSSRITMFNWERFAAIANELVRGEVITMLGGDPEEMGDTSLPFTLQHENDSLEDLKTYAYWPLTTDVYVTYTGYGDTPETQDESGVVFILFRKEDGVWSVADTFYTWEGGNLVEAFNLRLACLAYTGHLAEEPI